MARLKLLFLQKVESKIEKICICPGSFDPITVGHVDIITRASALFDRVIVVALLNVDKQPMFTVGERLDMVRRSTKHLKNVEIDSFSGLLADYAKIKNANAIVRGLRAVTDFEYEFQMSLMNKKINPDTETIFLTTSLENMYLSSSIVKQLASFGGDISEFVPVEIAEQIRNKIRGEKE